jgi:hypothetical protein
VTIWQYIASLGLAPSDWLLFSCALPIAWFVLVYGFFTKWWEDPFGWIILSGALGLLLVLASIIFSVFTGNRIVEPVRIVLYGLILISWLGKDVVLHRERHRGKAQRMARKKERSLSGDTFTGTIY